MPRPDHTKTVTLGDHTFRIRRLCGFTAAEAHAELVNICGAGAAGLVIVGGVALPKSERMDKALQAIRDNQNMSMLMVQGAIENRQMTGQSLRTLVNHFVLGQVALVREGVDDVDIETTQDLDKELDGSSDADIWASLIWMSVMFSVGPITAATGTDDDSPVTVQTSTE